MKFQYNSKKVDAKTTSKRTTRVLLDEATITYKKALRHSSTTTSSISAEAAVVLEDYFNDQSESAEEVGLLFPELPTASKLEKLSRPTIGRNEADHNNPNVDSSALPDIQDGNTLVTQRQPEIQSVPGAFPQAGINNVDGDRNHAYHNESNVESSSFSDVQCSNTLVTAELVDESSSPRALDDKREIERLTKELEELREQQLIAIAEPLQQTTTTSTESNFTMMPKKRPTSSKTKTGLSEEIDIYEPTWNPEEDGLKNNKPVSMLKTCLALHGRDRETAILQDCLLKERNQTKQLLMISGYSGCGKTALAFSLKHMIAEGQGLYVSGKFDLYLRDQPYFAIAAACTEICEAITSLVKSRSRKRSFQEIHDQLKSQLSPQDIQVLTPIIPELQEIMDYYKETPRPTATVPCNEEGQDAKNRFNYAFRLFIRVVSKYFAPLVVCFDDLQWADAASLETMQVLLTDPEITNLLTIGLYRSNEVSNGDKEMESHLLITVLNDLKGRGQEIGLEITEMDIGNLNEEAVLSVLMDMLSFTTSSPQLKELAALCHHRTLGNVYFLISFITMLEEDGLLVFDVEEGVFTWDVEEIKISSRATSNLVDLMKTKMSKLCKEMIQLLSLAACLGSSFERSKVEVTWNLLYPLVQLDAVFSAAMEEGFFECFDKDSSKYQWIHDKVHEAAFSLIPQDEASDFKVKVGTVLCKEMDVKELDRNIFLVVNLLNEATSDQLDDAQQAHLSQLNLQATHKARACSAFSSAAKYASKGIAYLPADCWSSSHYPLALELHCSAVELNEIIGNYEAMEVCSDAVLNNQSVPLLNKVRIYSAMASRLGNSGKLVEAIDLLEEVLVLLGCKFPKSPTIRFCNTLYRAIKNKIGARKRTSEEASRIPILQDPVKIETMKLLDRLSTYCYQSGSDLLPLTILKSTDLTLKHGVCEVSSPAFAASAAMLGGILGDLNAGFMYGRYALQLEEKFKFGVSSSRTKFLAGTTALPWQRPLQEAGSLLLESYSDGMASGDTESAAYAISYYIMFCFLRGCPLKQLVVDCSIYSKQMKELKRDTMHAYTTITWQAALNIMGLNADPLLLQGSALTEYDKFMIDHQDNLVIIALVHTFQLGLYAFYGEHERGANLFLVHGFDFTEVGPGDPLFMAAVCYGGISSFQMAKTTGKRKFIRHARKARSIIKGWTKQGNPNSAHFDALMDAELAVLQNKHRKAERYYQSSISTAARGGFVHDCALANERCGEFMLCILSNESGAAFHIREAAKMYSDWGAAKKVAMLKEKYPWLLSESQMTKSSCGFTLGKNTGATNP